MRAAGCWERPTVSEPYKKPPPGFPYRVCGTHPIIGYFEYGVVSRENAEERAEALRKEGFQDVTVHGPPTIPADLSAAMPGSS